MVNEKRISSDLEASDFFDSMPLISEARSLLRWIDSGKEVTASGVLRLKDVPEAARCVGLAVAASGQSKQPVEDQLPGFEALLPEDQAADTLEQEDIVQVRTMLHVPRLMAIWASLEGARLIEISAARVHLGEGASTFLAASDNDVQDGALAEIHAFVVEHLRRFLTADSVPNPFELAAQTTVLQILGYALTADPIRAADVAEDSVDDTIDIDLQELQNKIAHEYLTELESFGVVYIDTHYRVPGPLVEPVTEVLDVLEDSGPDIALASRGNRRTGRSFLLSSPVDNGQVLQLKISLKHAKPPIWRRLLVPASMTLDRLHLVIQTVFGWEHAHLHDFAHRDGLRMIDTSMMEGDEDLLEEATVSIGQLLEHPKDKLTYTYDFGDNWVHTIALEKTLEADAVNDADLPRCTGGRGAAPMEDSGGVWGWLELMAGANDPTHEHYDDYREWLDLAEGETFDPKSFSKADINRYLTALL